MICWLEAYLEERKQFVGIKNLTAEILPVMTSVPQGSILGSLPFIICINVLCLRLHPAVKIKHFEDDIIVYAEVRPTHEQNKQISCSKKVENGAKTIR